MPLYLKTTNTALTLKSGVARVRAAIGGAPIPPPAESTLVLLFLGESNAGGQMLVANFPAPLQAATSRVRILNVTTGLFENLAPGVNNNLDHNGLTPANSGWAMGLTTGLDANPAAVEPLYMVEAGQGGSMLSEWTNGSLYWNKAQTRVSQAIAQLALLGVTNVAWKIICHIGINDFIAGSPISVAAYQAAHIQLLNDARGWIGLGTAAQIVLPEFPDPVVAAYPAYCAAQQDIVGLMANAISVDMTGLPVNDPYHWNESGYVTGATNIVTAIA